MVLANSIYSAAYLFVSPAATMTMGTLVRDAICTHVDCEGLT